MHKIGEYINKGDIFILDNIFQKISDKIWDYAPISCFNLSRFFAILYAGMAILHDLNLDKDNTSIDFFMTGSFTIVILIHCQFLEFVIGKNSFNPARDYNRVTRLLFILLTLLLLFKIFSDPLDPIIEFIVICVYYFMSCQLRPPIKRERRVERLALDSAS